MSTARKEALAGALSATSWKSYRIGTDVAFGELKQTEILQFLQRTPGAGLLAPQTNEAAAKTAYSIAKNVLARTPVRYATFLVAIGGGVYAVYQFWRGDAGNKDINQSGGTIRPASETASSNAIQMRELGQTTLPGFGADAQRSPARRPY